MKVSDIRSFLPAMTFTFGPKKPTSELERNQIPSFDTRKAKTDQILDKNPRKFRLYIAERLFRVEMGVCPRVADHNAT